MAKTKKLTHPEAVKRKPPGLVEDDLPVIDGIPQATTEDEQADPPVGAKAADDGTLPEQNVGMIPTLVDMSSDEMRAAATGEEVDRLVFRDDADPLMVEALQLFRTLVAGRAINPFMQMAYNDTIVMITKLKERLCEPKVGE